MANYDANYVNNGDNAHKFDPNFTKNVIAATGPKCSPRLRKVMTSLIKHVHDFARENEITVDEWMTGVNFVGLSITGSDSENGD